MVTQESVDYIKKQRLVGFSDEQIFQSLIQAGWQEDQAKEAFAALTNPSLISKEIVSGENPQSTFFSDVDQNRARTPLWRYIKITVVVLVLVTIAFGIYVYSQYMAFEEIFPFIK